MTRTSLALILGIAWLSPGATAAETTTASFDTADCKVTLERDVRSDTPSLRLRPTCRLDFESTRSALTALLGEMHAIDAGVSEVSVFIGRIEQYPWLSESMARAARASPKWSVRRGRLRAADQSINAFAADLLFHDPTLRAVLPGWQLTSVSVEKVLVGPAEDYVQGAGLSGRLPFDAMCWLQWRRQPGRP